MRPGVRALAAAAVLCGLAATAGCGKVVFIGDAPASSAPPAGSAPATAPATPPPAPTATGGSQDFSGTAQPPGNNTLELVDGTAADNGVSGNGGTVVGAAVQQEPPNWVQLVAVRSRTLDAHLVDVNQSTLYRFDKDGADPSRTACEGECAVTWPPVTIKQGGKVYVRGVRPSAVGGFKRPDGTVQLTIGGWPIYRYSGDSAPGEEKGQGIGGTWFAVAPNGQKAVPNR
ncbi:hypothetical protein Sme01_68470 [Sphaerisporangium melleum]|uniref:Lipoprotein n=1 Tax=Sphaerisporangium melleum TaxID=321316 RepID=A0A917RLD5_9ACTN|nr:hypothetical protein GCM10007964_62500 [Sphaerisporangium melleum]GII74371.1 hypothetical protein Sme01_68470 [Sphaerisporangium melleum]